MDNKAKEFGLFIDGLRISRNLSREELTDDVMSISQYKRYIRGDTSIPNSKLLELADRLRFNIYDIHFLFDKQNNNEYENVVSIYIDLTKNEFEKAYKKSKDLDPETFISQYNYTFYNFCVFWAQHSLGIVSDVHVLDLYSRLIDYPNCIDNETFNFVEISVLIKIAKISAKISNYEGANFLYEILRNPQFKYTSSSDSMFLPSVYSTLASILGMQEEFEKVVDISSLGIEYCKKRETSSALPHLYYYKASAHFDLGQEKEALESAKRCFMALYLEGKPSKMTIFKNNFEEEFDMKLDDLIKL